jgi:hypothetical protein
MRGLIVASLALATGCFAPSERDGAVACGAAGECPPGFACHPPDNRCYRDPPGGGDDAAPADASLIDASADASVDGGFTPECSDGIDNDCDGDLDFPDDPGCTSGNDPNEHGTKECDDGVDNDDDGATDFQFGPGCGTSDPQCTDPNDPNESQ